ncbi:hypothetical protein [Virgibacillus doumboii]|uniref:hypothetical protein n=1 Tax=Virgibacillus doumboii TaxID=2697503 RepID=UPI0013DFAA45|nr:hypothetical protein [Virgibacillus doumboii]
MNHILQFTMGYLGYYLIALMALQAMVIRDDMVGSIILFIGLFFLVNYTQFLEKKHEKPKYGGYIKLILVVAFFISMFVIFFETTGARVE